jgi:hypothetical protein
LFLVAVLSVIQGRLGLVFLLENDHFLFLGVSGRAEVINYFLLQAPNLLVLGLDQPIVVLSALLVALVGLLQLILLRQERLLGGEEMPPLVLYGPLWSSVVLYAPLCSSMLLYGPLCSSMLLCAPL